jgi:hypothetical protein
LPPSQDTVSVGRNKGPFADKPAPIEFYIANEPSTAKNLAKLDWKVVFCGGKWNIDNIDIKKGDPSCKRRE